MIAFIIFKNDEPMKIVLNDDERALKEMKKLEAANYARQKNFFSSKASYRADAYWHLREVEVLT
jgi:hypothetical protein